MAKKPSHKGKSASRGGPATTRQSSTDLKERASKPDQQEAKTAAKAPPQAPASEPSSPPRKDTGSPAREPPAANAQGPKQGTTAKQTERAGSASKIRPGSAPPAPPASAPAGTEPTQPSSKAAEPAPNKTQPTAPEKPVIEPGAAAGATTGAAATSKAAAPAGVPRPQKPDTTPATAETGQPEAAKPTPGTAAQVQPATVPPVEELPPRKAPTPDVEAEQLEPPHAVEPAPAEEPRPAVHHLPSIFITHITPEMAPVAKVGGLADVVFGLTRELAIRGNHVEIILPKYDNMRYDHIWGLTPAYNDLWVPWYEGAVHCTVYFGFVHERKCFFIEPHSQDNFFNRGSIYGFNDDVLRYAFFARAAVEFLWKAGKHPDIIHCHDWQTALVPVYLYEIYQHLGMSHPRVCLTIHNFKHQGVTGGELLRATGLHHPERFLDYHRMRDNHNPHALNILKGGIVYSNFVTTVSPRYAFETKDQGQGFGLEPTLHTHHMKYGGVVNGIDYDVWNPEIDIHIPVHYSPESIDGKYDNKRALRHRLMLADNEKPIVAFIGRLDPQKGLDLVRHAIFYSLERGAQFVLLGSSPDQGINADFWGLKRMLNDSPDCHLEIGFDEDLAHLIYAGADMMLVPSRFEPCGLTQLIAMRYATIPVVRSVGGLADTVFDKDHSHRSLHERNGYVFENYDQIGLESALGRAIACYFNHPEHFRELMKNAMRYDYSWNIPGQDYLNIYHYIRSK
jgi:starch synthase